MNVVYSFKAYEDLKEIDLLQAHMLLDFFETHYHQARKLNDYGRVLYIGKWRFLFVENAKQIILLRAIK